MTNFNRVLMENAEKIGDHVAFVFDQDQITYKELNEQVCRIAHGLKQKGIEKNQHVALLLENSPEFILSLYACWRIGAIVIPINPAYTSFEISYIFGNAKINTIILLPELTPIIEQVKLEIPQHLQVIPINSSEFQSMLTYGDPLFKGIEVEQDDTAIILYTSGTTGKPKGAMLTHKNLYTNAIASGIALELSNEDIIIGVMPMYHIFALTICLNMPVVLGAKTIVMKKFSPKEFISNVKKHSVTFFGGVPTMYNFIYHYLQETKEVFTSVTHCASGGASLPVAILENFEKVYNIKIQEGYGLSEGAGVVTLNPRKLKIKPGTVGFPISDINVKIINTLGEEALAGEVGELLYKGPNVFKGYFEMPEATAEALKDGWLHTGDLAVKDEDGYIRIVDRKKDLIIVGGYNVYPREIEEVLYQHENVVEVGVISEPDEQFGEKVLAYVVLKNEISEQELLEFCKHHLAKYKVPSEIVFKQELPKTSSGKILRRALANRVY